MAIQKEFWVPAIEENLNKGLEAIRMVSVDDSPFSNGSTIHIPSAGTSATVSKGNSTYPVAITERTDQEISYTMSNYEIGPVRLGWADALQLSYDKLSSITNDFMGNLSYRMAIEFMAAWYYKATGSLVATSGTSTTTNWLGGSASGSLKHITGADVRNAASILDKQLVPQADRYLLLDYAMFWQLLGDLSYNADRVEVQAGLPTTVLPIHGFTVIQMPYVASVNTSDVIKTPAAADGSFTFASTDRPIGLAVQKSCLSMATTPIKAFDGMDKPEYFGDVLSASVRAGAKYRRYDGKGTVAIRATS